MNPTNCQNQHRVSEPFDCAAMARDVSEIKAALVGNEALGHRGLVSIVRDHDKRLRRIEHWYVYATGVAFALAVVYGVARDIWLH